MIALGAPALASAVPARAVAAEVARTPARPAAASAAEVASYAEREQQDREVAGYEGGNVVVIGISGTALLVVLLVLILI